MVPWSSYRTAPFVQAASRRGIETFLLSGKSTLDLPGGSPGAVFDPGDPDQALSIAVQAHAERPFSGICATDDSTMGLAARIAARLDLVFGDPAAVAFTRDKWLGRQRQREAGIKCPRTIRLDSRIAVDETTELPPFPLVVKPLALSASRGVIRVEDRRQLNRALSRIRRLLEQESTDPDFHIIAETYIEGFEVALEGILYAGELKVLAIFDKPEPLVGPYFEETLYTTPSRLGPRNLDQLVTTVQSVCDAYGLREGPVHAECRINDRGVWPLELASRTIGGRCARLLTLATGLTLEDLVLSHAMGEEPVVQPIQGGAGVLMVPVPESGVVRRVEGIGAARGIPGIEEVEIDVSTGQVITAWPEGGSYPGFVFSRGDTPLDAERALRLAQATIRIVVAPLLASSVSPM